MRWWQDIKHQPNCHGYCCLSDTAIEVWVESAEKRIRRLTWILKSVGAVFSLALAVMVWL